MDMDKYLYSRKALCCNHLSFDQYHINYAINITPVGVVICSTYKSSWDKYLTRL